MKKILVLLLLASCKGLDRPSENLTVVEDISERVQIVKVRNCDYIKSPAYAGYTFVHTGDCPNPIHFKQK